MIIILRMYEIVIEMGVMGICVQVSKTSVCCCQRHLRAGVIDTYMQVS